VVFSFLGAAGGGIVVDAADAAGVDSASGGSVAQGSRSVHVVGVVLCFV
jgi:hypothetical protein